MWSVFVKFVFITKLHKETRLLQYITFNEAKYQKKFRSQTSEICLSIDFFENMFLADYVIDSSRKVLLVWYIGKQPAWFSWQVSLTVPIVRPRSSPTQTKATLASPVNLTNNSLFCLYCAVVKPIRPEELRLELRALVTRSLLGSSLHKLLANTVFTVFLTIEILSLNVIFTSILVFFFYLKLNICIRIQHKNPNISKLIHCFLLKFSEGLLYHLIL